MPVIKEMSFKIDKKLECTREKGKNIEILEFYHLDDEIESMQKEIDAEPEPEGEEEF